MESIVWRPVLEGKVSITEIKQGTVTLGDLCKITALIDMKSDIEHYYATHPQKGDEQI